ncbi:MAG: hypothetical protein C4326_09200 [Ignavibacteria bacterium]
MKTRSVFILLVLFCSSAAAQLKIVIVERLLKAPARSWSSPRFSPDGKRVYFTTQGFNGIWEYTPAEKSLRRITDDPRSGYGFAISPDGKTIAYRRTRQQPHSLARLQELVVMDMTSKSTQVLAQGENVSIPAFAGSAVVYSVENATNNVAATRALSSPVLLGIEDTKIVVIERGRKRLLDPLGRGSYIWPMLSPDGKRIVATEMARGAFICDLRGRVVARLGARNAAVWTRDSRWLVYMEDEDDGHNVLSSDLYAVGSDGKRAARLTFTSDVREMNPHCSPTENKIVCDTLEGDILLMTYEEVSR